MKWALIFFIISIIAGLLGFTNVAIEANAIARILFFLCVIIFVAFLLLGLLAGKTLL